MICRKTNNDLRSYTYHHAGRVRGCFFCNFPSKEFWYVLTVLTKQCSYRPKFDVFYRYVLHFFPSQELPVATTAYMLLFKRRKKHHARAILSWRKRTQIIKKRERTANEKKQTGTFLGVRTHVQQFKVAPELHDKIISLIFQIRLVSYEYSSAQYHVRKYNVRLRLHINPTQFYLRTD